MPDPPPVTTTRSPSRSGAGIRRSPGPLRPGSPVRVELHVASTKGMVCGPSGSTHSVASGPTRVAARRAPPGDIVGVLRGGRRPARPRSGRRAHHDPGPGLDPGLHLHLPLVGHGVRAEPRSSRSSAAGVGCEASTSRYDPWSGKPSRHSAAQMMRAARAHDGGARRTCPSPPGRGSGRAESRSWS